MPLDRMRPEKHLHDKLDFELVFLRQSQHRVICIDTNYATMWSHNLRRDVANLSGAGTEIKHHIAFSDDTGWIAATVIFFPDLFRDRIKKSRVILNRTTEFLFTALRG